MSHWQFVIRPLTPVHIGAGESLEPYEYTIAGGRFRRLDLDGFLAALPYAQGIEFAETVGRDLAAAREFLRQQAPLVQAHTLYDCPASPASVQDYEDKLRQPLGDLTVRAAVRAGRMAILPGSSIKGAIRTALLYAKMPKPADGQRYERRGDQLQRDSFGHRDPLDDPFKALKISDSLPPYGDPGRLRLAEVWVYRREEGQWGTSHRGRLVVRLETTGAALSDGAAGESVHQVQLDERWQQQARPRFRLEMGGLVGACRAFYDEHLAGEAAFVRTFSQAASAYAALEQWRRELPEHAFLLRLGWGSGLDGVSVNRGLDYPRRTISRRLLEDGAPLGWVEVRVLEHGQPWVAGQPAAPEPPAEAEPPRPARADMAAPTRLADLRTGMVLTGTVAGVDQDGAVVDVGVGSHGRLYARLGGRRVRPGQRVKVEVMSVTPESKHLGLRLVEVLG